MPSVLSAAFNVLDSILKRLPELLYSRLSGASNSHTFCARLKPISRHCRHARLSSMSDSREHSPSAEERRKKDEADRKREEEEQSKLPYKWTQTLNEAEVSVSIPGNLRAKDLVVDLNKTHLKVQIRGQDPVIDVSRLYSFVQDSRIWIRPPPRRVVCYVWQ